MPSHSGTEMMQPKTATAAMTDRRCPLGRIDSNMPHILPDRSETEKPGDGPVDSTGLGGVFK